MVKRKSPTIILMAGGTGGHIYPALAVADKLRADGWNAHWLGSVGGMEETLVGPAEIPMSLLKISGLRGKGKLALLAAPFRLFGAILAARKVFRSLKPTVALGMGGFASGPGGVAARLTGCPLIVHEQNAIAGLTNRWLHKLSTLTLEAFPGAFAPSNKVITTGNPVRSELSRITALQKIESPRILVIGGSRGAAVFNQELPGIFAQVIEQTGARSGLTIVHQTGKGNAAEVTAAYQANALLAECVEVTEFINDMDQQLEQADLVICRAGAMTVAELAVAGRPAILVPYPHAVDDHQTANARYLSDAGAARLIAQSDLTVELPKTIAELLGNVDELIKMASAARAKAHPDATEQVAQMCRQQHPTSMGGLA